MKTKDLVVSSDSFDHLNFKCVSFSKKGDNFLVNMDESLIDIELTAYINNMFSQACDLTKCGPFMAMGKELGKYYVPKVTIDMLGLDIKEGHLYDAADFFSIVESIDFDDIHSEDIEMIHSMQLDYNKNNMQDRYYRVRVRGEIKYIMGKTGAPIKNAKGETAFIPGVLIDITKSKQDESALIRVNQELSDLQERFEIATSSAEVGVWEATFTDHQTIIDNEIYFDGTCVNHLNLEPSLNNTYFISDLENAVLESVCEEEQEKIFKKITDGLYGLADKASFLIPIKSFDKQKYIKVIAKFFERDEHGFANKAYGVMFDVTDQVLKEETIKQQTVTDALTCCKNRNALNKIIQSGIEGAELAFIDVNNFKSINDTFGYHIGDAILIEVAEHLKAHGNVDVYRIGGDEFVMISKDKEKAYKTSFASKNVQYQITLSIGVVDLAKFAYLSSDDVLKVANHLMRQSKHTQEEIVYLNEKHLEEYQNQVYIIRELDNALQQNYLKPYFQPIIDPLTGRLKGFETLVRWENKDIIIYPNEFLDVAILNNRIYDIDIMMYEQAVKFYADITDKFDFDDLFISSNFHVKSLDKLNIDELWKIDKKYSVPKEKIIIEVTEQTLVNEAVREKIKELGKIGYNIALDDFTAEHSSITYLTDMQFKIVKFDISFLHSIDSAEYGDKNKYIYKSIVDLCDGVGSDIIAEGVETKSHLGFISSLGIKSVQGYYFAKPLSMNDTIDFIAQKDSENLLQDLYKSISLDEIRDDHTIINISEPFEILNFNRGFIDIPFAKIYNHYQDLLEKDKEYVIISSTAMYNFKVAKLLVDNGYSALYVAEPLSKSSQLASKMYNLDGERVYFKLLEMGQTGMWYIDFSVDSSRFLMSEHTVKLLAFEDVVDENLTALAADWREGVIRGCEMLGEEPAQFLDPIHEAMAKGVFLRIAYPFASKAMKKPIWVEETVACDARYKDGSIKALYGTFHRKHRQTKAND